MAEQTPIPVQQPKKGMSRGCLVGIIIGVVIIILAGVGVGYVCMNAKKMAASVSKMVVTGIGDQITKKPVEGFDTERYLRVAKAFTARMDQPLSEEELNCVGGFMQVASTVAQKDDKTPEDLESLIKGMITCFPELAELDTTVVTDSTAVEDTTPVDDTSSVE